MFVFCSICKRHLRGPLRCGNQGHALQDSQLVIYLLSLHYLKHKRTLSPSISLPPNKSWHTVGNRRVFFPTIMSTTIKLKSASKHFGKGGLHCDQHIISLYLKCKASNFSSITEELTYCCSIFLLKTKMNMSFNISFCNTAFTPLSLGLWWCKKLASVCFI